MDFGVFPISDVLISAFHCILNKQLVCFKNPDGTLADELGKKQNEMEEAEAMDWNDIDPNLVQELNAVRQQSKNKRSRDSCPHLEQIVAGQPNSSTTR